MGRATLRVGWLTLALLAGVVVSALAGWTRVAAFLAVAGVVLALADLARSWHAYKSR